LLKKLSIRAGDTYHDLEQVCVLELKEPVGWITVPLELSMDQTCYNPHPRGLFSCCDGFAAISNRPKTVRNSSVPRSPLDHEPLRAHLVQVSIDGMHQNGRDTHIRQIKVTSDACDPESFVSYPRGSPPLYDECRSLSLIRVLRFMVPANRRQWRLYRSCKLYHWPCLDH